MGYCNTLVNTTKIFVQCGKGRRTGDKQEMIQYILAGIKYQGKKSRVVVQCDINRLAGTGGQADIWEETFQAEVTEQRP